MSNNELLAKAEAAWGKWQGNINCVDDSVRKEGFVFGHMNAAEPRDKRIERLLVTINSMPSAVRALLKERGPNSAIVNEELRERIAELEANYQTALDEWNETINSKRKLEDGVARLREALKADASDLWNTTQKIRRIIRARDWHDERYKEEVSLAFKEVIDVIDKVQPPASKRYRNALAANEPEPEPETKGD